MPFIRPDSSKVTECLENRAIELTNSILCDNSVDINLNIQTMKHGSKYFLVALSFTLITACGGKKEQKEEVTELSYREFYELMFEDYKNRVEWHEDDYNQEGKAAITITNREQCKNRDCGEKTYVKNTSPDRSIRVVVKTAFSIPNTLPYIANQFMMAPGDEVYLTCTSFCFNDNSYNLDHEIVVAEYIED